MIIIIHFLSVSILLPCFTLYSDKLFHRQSNVSHKVNCCHLVVLLLLHSLLPHSGRQTDDRKTFCAKAATFILFQH